MLNRDDQELPIKGIYSPKILTQLLLYWVRTPFVVISWRKKASRVGNLVPLHENIVKSYFKEITSQILTLVIMKMWLTIQIRVIKYIIGK